MSVYDDIRDERNRHAAKGYDADHDREHGVDHLVSWAMFYASKGDRRNLVKSASLVAAAIECIDRETVTKPTRQQVPCTACDYGYPASACSSNCDCGAC